ncbi:MAG: OmpA family protein [Gemmatimonadota bacterium]|nr:OmpA family protein [Gemmatimonadota bacterium]
MTDVTEIRETERGLAIVLGQGLFASGQYQLSPRARSQIGTIGAVLAQYPDNRISVEGHTDSVGRELANQRLSEMRAEAVRAALIAERVDPARIDMAGYGQSQPVADNNTAEGRGRNRRVEIVIVGARRPAPPGGG